MVTIDNLEASLFKYLYETMEVTHGVRIFDNIFIEDFDSYNEWIVIDPLTNSLGGLPKAIYHLHLAVKKSSSDERKKLRQLCDKVNEVINKGTRIDIYSTETTLRVGEIVVSETLLSPVSKHAGGGSFRSLTLTIQYYSENTLA